MSKVNKVLWFLGLDGKL